MTAGSCYCGAFEISISGAPAGVATCHCRDCRKISGSVFSLNWLVDAASASVSSKGGDDKRLGTLVTTASSGNRMTNHFCTSCGTTLYRVSSAAPGSWVVKAGVLDDDAALSSHQPQGENFVGSRIGWVKPLEGTMQSETHCRLS